MPDSDHEEADSRVILHTAHALAANMSYIYVMSNDTDVIIIALGVYHLLRSRYIFEDIVIEFGIGKNKKIISIKNLAEKLGQTRCQALVYLHCLSGCDTTSCFKNIGKKKAFDTMKAFPEIERVFADFLTTHFNF